MIQITRICLKWIEIEEISFYTSPINFGCFNSYLFCSSEGSTQTLTFAVPCGSHVVDDELAQRGLVARAWGKFHI